MFCKDRLVASAVLVILLFATMTEPATAAKGKNNRRKGEHMRLRRTTKYTLELGSLKLLADFPTHSRHFHDASFRNRSLSPWIYKEDSDANRYPSSIFKAECVSTHCLNSRGFLDPGLNTRLVKQEMLVLRKKKTPGDKITFHVEKLLVPVACVCVRPDILGA
ncbi:interleukin-17A-like [Pristis pectinata]|uniref:interleukin-17A-like n=1 Tax=Pristis pectinata TaxID=685728 RepID=UPI00223E5DBC|nr:interleukin-17A-like [Pristis pectinata]